MNHRKLKGIKYQEYYSEQKVEIFDLEEFIPKIEANEVKSTIIKKLEESHPLIKGSYYDKREKYILFLTELFFKIGNLNQFLEIRPRPSYLWAYSGSRYYILNFVDENYTSHFSFDIETSGNNDINIIRSLNDVYNNFSNKKKCCYASVEYIRQKETPLFFPWIESGRKISKDNFVYVSGINYYLLPIEQLIKEKIEDKTIELYDGYSFKADFNYTAESISVEVTCFERFRKYKYYIHDFMLDLNSFELVRERTRIEYGD